MRVVLVTTLERGGPIEHAVGLAGGLVSAGVTVDAVCASEQVAERFRARGAAVAVIPLPRRLDPQFLSVLRYASNADVVHAHDRRAGLCVRLGPRPDPGGIRIYSAHGLPEPFLPPPVGSRRPGLRARLMYRGLDAALCRRADAVAVPSRAAARAFEQLLGYPSERLFVVPNGVEAGAPQSRDGSLVGTMSLLEPVKGIDVFLRAAALLARVRPELRFGVFGTGSLAEQLHALARELGIWERVEWPGHVPASEALRRLNVFVLPSYMEAAPIALLEAMAAGVPVAATRVGGVPEVAIDGSAQLVESGDADGLAAAIERLLDDEALAAAQIRAARERVLHHFTLEHTTRATLDLYAHLLARRRQRSSLRSLRTGRTTRAVLPPKQ